MDHNHLVRTLLDPRRALQHLDIGPRVTRIMNAGRMTKWEGLAHTKKEIDFLKVAENYGLKHGFSIPLTGANGGAYMLSLAGHEKTTDDQMKVGMIVAHLAQAKFIDTVDVMQPASVNDLVLNDKQKQILCAVAEGWTSNEVADQLGMMRDGVNYHLREAKKALGTHNLPHTVATALRRKLI